MTGHVIDSPIFSKKKKVIDSPPCLSEGLGKEEKKDRRRARAGLRLYYTFLMCPPKLVQLATDSGMCTFTESRFAPRPEMLCDDTRS